MITDAEIRKLRDTFDTKPDVWLLCQYALGRRQPGRDMTRAELRTLRTEARARCAEILEARRKESP